MSARWLTAFLAVLLVLPAAMAQEEIRPKASYYRLRLLDFDGSSWNELCDIRVDPRDYYANLFPCDARAIDAKNPFMVQLVATNIGYFPIDKADILCSCYGWCSVAEYLNDSGRVFSLSPGENFTFSARMKMDDYFIPGKGLFGCRLYAPAIGKSLQIVLAVNYTTDTPILYATVNASQDWNTIRIVNNSDGTADVTAKVRYEVGGPLVEKLGSLGLTTFAWLYGHVRDCQNERDSETGGFQEDLVPLGNPLEKEYSFKHLISGAYVLIYFIKNKTIASRTIGCAACPDDGGSCCVTRFGWPFCTPKQGACYKENATNATIDWLWLAAGAVYPYFIVGEGPPPSYDLLFKRSYVTSLFLAPGDFLEVVGELSNDGEINLTADNPIRIEFQVTDVDGYVVYNETREVAEDFAANQPPIPLYFSVNLTAANLFDVTGSSITAYGTAGLAEKMCRYGEGKVINRVTNAFEVRRLISFREGNQTRSKYDWTANLGEERDFTLIVRNPFNIRTEFALSAQQGGGFPLEFEFNPDSLNVARASGSTGWGIGLSFMTVKVPDSGKGLHSEEGYCAATEANITVTAPFPPERAEELGEETTEDFARLYVAISPKLLGKALVMPASPNVLLWFGNESFSLSDNLKKFKKIKAGAAVLKWGQTARVQTFATNCLNDYTCCTRAFCNQKQLNEMFKAFQTKANQTFHATAYRHCTGGLMEKTKKAFTFSAVAQLAPGVSFPAEVLSAATCGEKPGAYSIQAVTKNGRKWEYVAQVMATGENSYFHGYTNATQPPVELCGLDPTIPRFKCVLAPTIVDGGKLKRFGGGEESA